MKLTRMLLWVLFSLANTQAHAAPTTGQVLKVLQLNFNDELVMEDGDYRFRDRRFPAIIQWINSNDPDIVFIEEGFNFHGYFSVIQAIAEAVNYDYYYRVGMGIPGLFADSDGFLVKKKFHLNDDQNFECPDGAPEIGNGNGWVLPFGANTYAVGGRIVLDNGTPMYIYNTHLISEDNSHPNADTDDVIAIDDAITRDIVNNGDDPTQTYAMISGDFNADPTDAPHQALRAFGYHDTFAEAHPGIDGQNIGCSNCNDPTTIYFNPMTIAPGLFPKQVNLGPDNRIDYTFIKGPQIQTLASTLIFTSTVNNIWMTDHSGLLSTVAIGGSPPFGNYPNPIRDTNPPTIPSWVIHLNSDNLKCTSIFHCTETLPNQAVSASLGITFVNDTHDLVRITLSGNGHVWARNDITLEGGESTAFYFDPNEHYTFTAHRVATLKKLEGSVDSILP